MTLLSRAALACALALPLAACGTTGAILLPPDATPAERALAQACTNLAPAYLAFTTYDLVRPVGARTRATVDAAYAEASAICAAPPETAIGRLVALNRAIANIRAARREA